MCEMVGAEVEDLLGPGGVFVLLWLQSESAVVVVVQQARIKPKSLFTSKNRAKIRAKREAEKAQKSSAGRKVVIMKESQAAQGLYSAKTMCIMQIHKSPEQKPTTYNK